MRTFIVLLLSTGLALGAAISQAEACTCLPTPPARESFESAAAIFAARVLAVNPRPDQDPRAFPEREVELEVERSFKGPPGPYVTVYTASNSAACGYHFEEGVRYLVYAYDRNGGLGVSLCGRTAELANAREDLEVIAPGSADDLLSGDGSSQPEPPAQPGPPPPQTLPPRSGCGSCSAGSGGAPLPAAVALLALLWWMRRPRSETR